MLRAYHLNVKEYIRCFSVPYTWPHFADMIWLVASQYPADGHEGDLADRPYNATSQ